MATHTTLPVQQGQVSTYNHPCADLLDGGRRREYLDIAVPLYRASIEGDLEAAKDILDQDRRNLVAYSITEKKETPLHVAVAGHSTAFVSYLVNKMETVELELQNEDGNTAFCIAAISGNVDMAKIMLDKNQALATIGGSENMMPLYLAAFHGKHTMVKFLYNVRTRGGVWTNDVMDGVLLKCIEAGMFDVALRILEDNNQLPQHEHAWDVLHLLAGIPEAFYVIPQMKSPFTSLLPRTILEKNGSNAMLLLRLLWKRIMENPKDVIDKILRGPMIEESNMETYPSQILFIAAKMNNTLFLVELIHEYPGLIWKRNDDGQTIFHVAVAHRHHDVYSLLYEIGSMKDLITPITDQQGNNILHLVGKIPEKMGYEDRLASQFQMFNEFFWYKEVQNILPPACRKVKNMEGQTPRELFIDNHEKLVSAGLKSIYDTVNISMVVAALVCTITFSVVFQIPGGFDQTNGFPMFLHDRVFIFFLTMDSLSFLFAATAVILFLAVILYRQHGNMKALYLLWVYGQLALLTSTTYAFAAFIISFSILYPQNTWLTVIIYAVGYPIMCLFSVMNVYIVVDTITARGFIWNLRKQHKLFRRN